MGEQRKILVIEDDKDINQLLCTILTRENYKAVSAYSGTEALFHIDQEMWDLLLLDLMLPGKRGEDVLLHIREKSDVPIIIISAKEENMTKVQMLRKGADDYITKPFHKEEVLARIEAQLRRYKKSERKNILRFKNIELDVGRKQVFMHGKEIALTAREYYILKLFLSSPHKIFTKENIFESVWQMPYYQDGNTVNVHMSHLRSKLTKADPKETYIETIWGMGYRLKR